MVKKKNWLYQKGGRITAGQDQISLLKGGILTNTPYNGLVILEQLFSL